MYKGQKARDGKGVCTRAANRVHTVSGTCAHALPVFCLPAFVHCIYMHKITPRKAFPFDEIGTELKCENYYCGV